MKSFLIFFIVALFLPSIESNTYNLQIKQLLTTEVCSIGIFVLDAELNIPIKESLNYDAFFKVYLRNSNSHQGYTGCFLLHFPGIIEVKVGCILPGFEEAIYQVLPYTSTVSYSYYGHTINILPFVIKQPFVIKTGLELYYFSPVYEIKLNFAKADEGTILELYLFSETSSLEKSIVALDDISFQCAVYQGIKLLCPIIAKNLKQERNHIYQANLVDTNSKIKHNYFLNPIEVTLQYIN